jgi:Acetyltransferase (GNAT) domain
MTLTRRAAILAKGCGYYEQPMVDAWVADGAAERVQRYEQQIADPELITLIAESGDDVLGFVIADPVNSELCTIYVKPNDSGRVGRALLAEAEMLAFRTSDRLTLVASLNAVQFYAENGYVDEGQVHWQSHDGSRSPCRKMRKERGRA